MPGEVRLSAYGSYVSDLYTPDGDIDLCIEGFVLKCATLRKILYQNIWGMKARTERAGPFHDGLSDANLSVHLHKSPIPKFPTVLCAVGTLRNCSRCTTYLPPSEPRCYGWAFSPDEVASCWKLVPCMP